MFLKFISDIFLFGVSLTDWPNISFFAYLNGWWIVISICLTFMFPTLTGKRFDDNKLEINLVATEKILVFIMLWIGAVAVNIIATVSFNYVAIKIKPSWAGGDLKKQGKPH